MRSSARVSIRFSISAMAGLCTIESGAAWAIAFGVRPGKDDGLRRRHRDPQWEPAMIRELTRLAHRLDAWLREHLGRPYTVVLAIGLVYGIIASVKALIHEAESRFDVFKLVTAVLFQLALLINQLAQFHEYRQEREARKARRPRR